MQIQIGAKRLELTAFQRETVDRRLRYALGRFGGRIRRVEVLVTDENGPRGGIDTTCRILVKTAPRGEVRAEVTDIGVELAVSRAVQRVARSVSSELQRWRDHRQARTSPNVEGIGEFKDVSAPRHEGSA